MFANRRKVFPLLFAVTIFFSFLCGCSVNAPKEEESGTKIFYFAARRVYDAAINVYTGELLSKELSEEGADVIAPTYAIKVKVHEVFKGDFQPGEIVEDLCPAGFSDLGCKYLFMTGVDPAYGYDSNTYQEADDVYSGKVLKKEPYQPASPGLTALYKVTVEVQEVVKGDLQPGETVEDITSGRSEEIRDDVLFMTAEDNPYLGQRRLTATTIVYNSAGNLYSMVKLPGDNRVEYSAQPPENENYDAYDEGIKPPKTEDELMQQIQTPLENNTYTPFIPRADDTSVPVNT